MSRPDVWGIKKTRTMMTFPEQITVYQALTDFYNSHDFGEDGGINQSIAFVAIGPFKLPIPNTQQRKDAIWLHDLHHLLNGYETTWRGEGQVSAWELATGGFGWRLYVWLLVLITVQIGVLLYPASTFRAFVRGTYCRPILSLGLAKSSLMHLPVGELQHRIGLSTADMPARLGHYVRFGLLWLLYVGGLFLIGLGTYSLFI